MTDIKVSVLCLAYNHEKYIRNALEGFVKQKTNFKYEVLINDDCSTDNTASIIEEYEQKYPNIIKPIYQSENQFSKHKGIIKTFLLPKAKGKYVALCEGDDCWIDDNKLQMQVDYLENNPQCSFCFTNAVVHNNVTGENVDFFGGWVNLDINKLIQKDKLDLKEILEVPFLPTASFMFPKSNYDNFPKEYNIYCFGGDRKLVLYSTLLGFAHYIDKKTSKYNVGVEGSATTNWGKASPKDLYKINESFVQLYENIDKLTGYCYSTKIFDAAMPARTTMLLTGYNRNLLMQDDFYKTYKKSKYTDKIKIYLTYHNPRLLKLILNLKRKLIK